MRRVADRAGDRVVGYLPNVIEAVGQTEGSKDVEVRARVSGYLAEIHFRDGQMVKLALTGNMSTGGISIDRTFEAHPENVEIAEEAARMIGLDIAGIDFICPDITEPVRETADPGHEESIEQQAKRDHEREAGAVDAQIGHHRLEEGTDGVAHSGGYEDHEREGEGDPPAVEDAGRGHERAQEYSSLV